MSPERISAPRYWRTRDIRMRLMGEKCPDNKEEGDEGCGGLIFPPRDICPFCGTNTASGKKAVAALAGKV